MSPPPLFFLLSFASSHDCSFPLFYQKSDQMKWMLYLRNREPWGHKLRVDHIESSNVMEV
jgi:hypothetical protein